MLDPVEEPGEIVSHGTASSTANHQHQQVSLVTGRAMVGDELPDGLGQLTTRRVRKRECVLHLHGKRGTTHRPDAEVVDNVFSLAVDSGKHPRPEAQEWRGCGPCEHGNPEPRRYTVLKVEPPRTRTSSGLRYGHLLAQPTDPFTSPTPL